MKVRHHVLNTKSRKNFRPLPQRAIDGKRAQAIKYLEQKLSEAGFKGEVVAIITYNQLGRHLSCFGRRLDEGAIFRVMNSSTRNRIRYPEWHHLSKWTKGLFVPLPAFEPKQTGWVALIGTAPPGDTEFETIPFGP